MTTLRVTLCALIALWLAGCASTPGGDGGYYEDDGPPVDSNIDLSSIPPAVPKNEPLSEYGNPPRYTVFGETYHTLDSAEHFTQTGIASWYGRQFHGQRTSSGEPYDMFRMTAAHKTLPLPSYVRVTNLRSGKQVIVRVNDRGPFHDDRIIDLSYVAALKLGVVRHGSAPVRIETVTADDMAPPQVAAQQSRAVGARQTSSAAAKPAAPRAATTVAVQRLPNDAARARATPAVADAAEQTGNRPGLYLQVGAFSQRGNARQIGSRLRDLGIDNVTITPGRSAGATLYRVRVGPFTAPSRRQAVRRNLASQNIPAIPVHQHSD